MNEFVLKVKVDLSDESKGILRQVIEAMSGGSCRCHSAADTVAAPNPRRVEDAAEPDTTLDEEPVDAEEETESPQYTAADVQKLVQELASPTGGKRAEVRAIVKKYAEKVSLIPADKYDTVMEQLLKLKEGA